MARKKQQTKVAWNREPGRGERKARIAQVSSVVALSLLERNQIGQILGALFGRMYTIENRVDESVIGGLYIKIGDKEIDATLRAKIEKLRERLLP